MCHYGIVAILAVQANALELWSAIPHAWSAIPNAFGTWSWALQELGVMPGAAARIQLLSRQYEKANV